MGDNVGGGDKHDEAWADHTIEELRVKFRRGEFRSYIAYQAALAGEEVFVRERATLTVAMANTLRIDAFNCMTEDAKGKDATPKEIARHDSEFFELVETVQAMTLDRRNFWLHAEKAAALFFSKQSPADALCKLAASLFRYEEIEVLIDILKLTPEDISFRLGPEVPGYLATIRESKKPGA
jgi:hypothetical protein